MKILTLFLICLISNSTFANPTSYYYLEKDGKNHTIFYKAFCSDYKEKNYCSLKSISIGNSASNLKCGVTVRTLVKWREIQKSGDTRIISESSGGCGYINTYHISDTGMIQVKSSPKKKKMPWCSVFKPKTFSMEYHKDVSTIRLNVAGCSELNIIAFD